MTNTLNKTLVAAGALLALTATSHALVLASWDAWADSSAGSYNADSEFTGFQGVISAPEPSNRALTSGFGSNDGTYGSVLSGATTTDNTALLVRKGASGSDDQGWNIATLTLTNNSGSAFTIDSIHFDIGVRGDSGDAFTLVYTSGGLGPASTAIASETGITDVGNLGDADDFDYTLATFLSDTTLDHGQSAIFTLTINNYTSDSASSTFDNVAFQGTVVPEPSSFALLAGCLGMAWVMVRRRV